MVKTQKALPLLNMFSSGRSCSFAFIMTFSFYAGWAGELPLKKGLPLRRHWHRETLPLLASTSLSKCRSGEAGCSLLQLWDRESEYLPLAPQCFLADSVKQFLWYAASSFTSDATCIHRQSKSVMTSDARFRLPPSETRSCQMPSGTVNIRVFSSEENRKQKGKPLIKSCFKHSSAKFHVSILVSRTVFFLYGRRLMERHILTDVQQSPLKLFGFLPFYCHRVSFSTESEQHCVTNPPVRWEGGRNTGRTV